MGGKVFEPDGLHTPRMPPRVYTHVRHDVTERLKELFAEVRIPIDAPEKMDHGDIDVLVVARDLPQTPSDEATIAHALGAVRFKKTVNSTTAHYAIPWPTSPDQKERDEDCDKVNLSSSARAVAVNDDDDEDRFIQVDVHICNDIDDLNFTIFLHSHGDLGSILGSLIRPFGFTCSLSGLYARIEETEYWNKNESRVLMTRSPDQVLEYLGLDKTRWDTPFSSYHDCMSYIASCRFHDPGRHAQAKTNADGDDEVVGSQSRLHNNNDRKRVINRPMFRYWIEQYLPAHKEDPPGSAASLSRQEALDLAKVFFGANFAQRYNERRRINLRVMGQNELWANFKRRVPATQPSDVTYAMKGFKREILVDDPGKEQWYSTPLEDLESVKAAYRDGRFDDVEEWAIAHWEAIRDRQIERSRSHVPPLPLPSPALASAK